LSRKLQDAEGEAKRARMEMQEVKTKHGDAILKLKEQQAENDKLVTGLKLLSQQVIELEENGGADEEMEADLAAAEELNEQLEEQIKTLKVRLIQVIFAFSSYSLLFSGAAECCGRAARHERARRSQGAARGGGEGAR
jgi:hypothetical protein